MNPSIRLAEEADYPVMHAILVLCGEHMSRVEGMSHWYPYGSIERFSQQTAGGKVYGVYEDGFLVGTFYLTEQMPHYYANIAWANPAAKALYGSHFGILPMIQKRGIGAWVMGAVDKLVAEENYQALRFDAVSHNESLIAFYDKLAYQRCGIIKGTSVSVICYEKTFGN